MFRVRVLATQEEIALIAQAARKQRLSVSQFVTRVMKEFGKNLKSRKIAPRGRTSPRRGPLSNRTELKRVSCHLSKRDKPWSYVQSQEGFANSKSRPELCCAATGGSPPQLAFIS